MQKFYTVLVVLFKTKAYCDYLLTMSRIDEVQAVLEQLTLSDFKK